MLRNLPSAYFSGVRIRYISEEKCSVSVPFKWFTKNPFRSTYFACLAMAAELSTGALAMANVYGQRPGVSMLVVKLQAEYFKKATDITLFTCNEGLAIKDAVTKAIETKEAQALEVISTGYNTEGELIARFTISWSFKAKQN